MTTKAINDLNDRLADELGRLRLVAETMTSWHGDHYQALSSESLDALVEAYKRAGSPTPDTGAEETACRIDDCLRDGSEPQEEFGLPGHRKLVYFTVEGK